MRWHKEVRKEEPGILRHPPDGMAWKHFDNIYPDFAIDSKSIQMGLASDGFNPFSNLSSSYSLWPVILIPYNMPPWASPNELKELWHGIDAYDSYGVHMFKLKDVVLWTISDFPAYAYLFGWSTAGKLACPVCLEDRRSRRITDKQCFTGHRCYLSANHSWKRSKDYDGFSELRDPPRTFTGEDILKQLEEVHVRTPGKAPNNSSRKCKRGANELNGSKRSVLFDLSYWSTLLLRHNLDVMHIEKNVCDNIAGTLLDIEGKTKDNLKARKDLQDLNIREELWLKKTASNKYEKPHASYTFTREECKSFCQFIRTVRLPDGYCKVDPLLQDGCLERNAIWISQTKVQKPTIISDDLYALSQGALERYHSYQSCVVNGVQFCCKEYDDTLQTQCSGVCTEGDHNNENILYYGFLIEILELSFIFYRKIYLFRCKWFNSDPKDKSVYKENDLTSINTKSNWYVNEPFILANQAQQVFYLLDMRRGSNWRFIQKVNHRNVYDIPETSEVVSNIPNNDVFQADESVQLPPFRPVED
ncbi:uncharacterized protein LOC141660047 [Apium graveolens]|uniref:uncharacterized protein LOC141660047 n=1 Tax=Apium graveolens TaxID=4045 RepID=UPI003D7A69E7